MSALPERRGTLESLHAALLAADSATSVLESFFGAITVQRRDQPSSPNPGLRERLRLATDDVLRHRAVWLLAGDRMLSQAELWYVANRLPADRIQSLETSDTPFGRIMKPLGLKRIVIDGPPSVRPGTNARPHASRHPCGADHASGPASGRGATDALCLGDFRTSPEVAIFVSAILAVARSTVRMTISPTLRMAGSWLLVRLIRAQQCRREDAAQIVAQTWLV